MITLALDTACETCAVGLSKNEQVLAHDSVVIGIGHAEFLTTQIENVMKQAAWQLSQVDRIVVNIGPGSFTGIRVGVATARGLALALQKPAIGVNNLEALAYETAKSFQNYPIMVIQTTSLERFFTASFDENGYETAKPNNLSAEELLSLITPDTILAGSGAKTIAEQFSLPNSLYEKPHADIANFAFLGATKQPTSRPSPLYLRAPDAKPKEGFAIERKG